MNQSSMYAFDFQETIRTALIVQISFACKIDDFANSDFGGGVTISDAVYLINYMFSGGPMRSVTCRTVSFPDCCYLAFKTKH
ncbi:MAG: hypothetical protein IPH59_06810 [bacterium]|nr:hypothetical protein [bacterium]